MVEPSGEHVADPVGNIKALMDQVSAVVTHATQMLSPASLERAIGAPGSPGDEAAIRDVAGELVTAYGQLIAWGLGVRNADVDPQWRPTYLALSKYVSQPLHQFQDFSAAFSASVGRVTSNLHAGKPAGEQIQLALKLSIDPAASAEFKATLEALKKAT